MSRERKIVALIKDLAKLYPKDSDLHISLMIEQNKAFEYLKSVTIDENYFTPQLNKSAFLRGSEKRIHNLFRKQIEFINTRIIYSNDYSYLEVHLSADSGFYSISEFREWTKFKIPDFIFSEMNKYYSVQSRVNESKDNTLKDLSKHLRETLHSMVIDYFQPKIIKWIDSKRPVIDSFLKSLPGRVEVIIYKVVYKMTDDIFGKDNVRTLIEVGILSESKRFFESYGSNLISFESIYKTDAKLFDYFRFLEQEGSEYYWNLTDEQKIEKYKSKAKKFNINF